MSSASWLQLKRPPIYWPASPKGSSCPSQTANRDEDDDDGAGGATEGHAGENRVLRQKLQSKTEALLILTKELEKARGESDEVRELLKKLQQGSQPTLPADSAARSTFNSRTLRDDAVAARMAELRNENRRLLLERDSIRRNLAEREEDVRLLRNQLRSRLAAAATSGGASGPTSPASGSVTVSTAKSKARSTRVLVSHLELAQMKHSALKRDIQSLLDEKEDLVQERDAYKGKVHRLNHAMGALLKSGGRIDLECLLSENLFLAERLRQVRDEKELANEMGRKYKMALEQSDPAKQGGHGKPIDTMKDQPDGGSGTAKPNGVTEEIKSLMATTTFPCPLNLDLNMPDSLQVLCLTLLETLKDRMLQLKNLRKANKQIMNRLEELEASLNEHPIDQGYPGSQLGTMIFHPSEFLMSGYSNSTVDLEEDVVDTGGGKVDLSPTSGSCSSVLGSRGVSYHKDSLCLTDIEADLEGWEGQLELNNLPGSEELSEHLQSLVDKAMIDLDKGEQS